MRKIPVYDTSSTDKIKQHVAQWDGVWLNDQNYKEYTRTVCDTVGCRAGQHLEISKNSIHRFGKRVRTASLSVGKGDTVFSCESLYQGSKVSQTGNRHWLYSKGGNFSLREKYQKQKKKK